MPNTVISDYFSRLAQHIESAEYTDSDGKPVDREQAFEGFTGRLRTAASDANKVLFCGNGGSAGICSHMATDFFKNGGVKALALNDSSALTCLANDYGYEFVFSKQIEMIANQGDILVAISSSGRSKNILNGLDAARAAGCYILTLSGFAPDNPLRGKGDLNIHVAAPDYGFVETAHLALISAMLDIHMGWPNIKYPT
jgi:D-sedoheptulose 7-phosphate isomerase